MMIIDEKDGRPRAPPGQRLTEQFPVLHYGEIPEIDLKQWRLRVFGMVEKEISWNWQELMTFPQVEDTSDIHCVTGWSRSVEIPKKNGGKRVLGVPTQKSVIIAAINQC